MPRSPIGEVAMTSAERVRKHRANLTKAEIARRRIQRRHGAGIRGELDAYFTCPEAVISLLHLERQYLPRSILGTVRRRWRHRQFVPPGGLRRDGIRHQGLRVAGMPDR
jgi:hypothetical protein